MERKNATMGILLRRFVLTVIRVVWFAGQPVRRTQEKHSFVEMENSTPVKVVTMAIPLQKHALMGKLVAPFAQRIASRWRAKPPIAAIGAATEKRNVMMVIPLQRSVHTDKPSALYVLPTVPSHRGLRSIAEMV